MTDQHEDAAEGGPRVTAAAALIEGRTAWEAALLGWLDQACAAGARELWWCDADFGQWPLGQRAWIERLGAWVGPRRQIVVLCARPEAMLLGHPRWARWRRTWAHAVSLWQVGDDDIATLPGVALAPGHGALEVLPGKVLRARTLATGPDVRRLHDLLRTIQGRSAPGPAAQVLGLSG